MTSFIREEKNKKYKNVLTNVMAACKHEPDLKNLMVISAVVDKTRPICLS